MAIQTRRWLCTNLSGRVVSDRLFPRIAVGIAVAFLHTHEFRANDAVRAAVKEYEGTARAGLGLQIWIAF